MGTGTRMRMRMRLTSARPKKSDDPTSFNYDEGENSRADDGILESSAEASRPLPVQQKDPSFSMQESSNRSSCCFEAAQVFPQGRCSSGRSGYKTACEVQNHVTEDDCWIIANNKVYDVTDFLSLHPAGKEAILKRAGKDCTTDYNYHSRNGQDVFERYFIAKLSPCKCRTQRLGFFETIRHYFR